MPTTLGLPALATINIVVSQGADNVYQLFWGEGDPEAPTPVDLTGYSARAQMRDTVGGVVWGTWVSPADIEVDADGYITLTVPHATTETTAWNGYDKGVWDIELTSPSGVVTRLAMGKVVVSHDVTRS